MYRKLQLLCTICNISNPYRTSQTLDGPEVVKVAMHAKAKGVSRFCMGAAWREVRDNGHFERIPNMLSEVKQLDLEVCCSLHAYKSTGATTERSPGINKEAALL